MKKLILTLMLLASVSAFAGPADSAGESTQEFASDYGKLVVQVRNVFGEASQELSVSVVCNGRLAKPIIVKPRLKFLEAICNWREPEWDEKSTDLVLHYSVTAPDKDDRSQCTNHLRKRYVIRELCTVGE